MSGVIDCPNCGAQHSIVRMPTGNAIMTDTCMVCKKQFSLMEGTVKITCPHCAAALDFNKTIPAPVKLPCLSCGKEFGVNPRLFAKRATTGPEIVIVRPPPNHRSIDDPWQA